MPDDQTFLSRRWPVRVFINFALFNDTSFSNSIASSVFK